MSHRPWSLPTGRHVIPSCTLPCTPPLPPWQVFGVARQALSLVAGEAIDAYLTSQLARLRDQYTVGRIIASIQASLWPGGVFFWYTATGRAQQAAAAAWRAAQAAAAQEVGGGGSGGAAAAAADGGGGGRPAAMQPERFLEPG